MNDIGKPERATQNRVIGLFRTWFFSTVQFIFAGNDSEGLQYGSIGTEGKYFLKWKEDEQDNRRFRE